MKKFIFCFLGIAAAAGGSAYDFYANTITGESKALSDYSGNVLLIVNTASKCGFTKQYAGLQALYEKYKDRGLVVLGVPANNFMRQEPGTNEEIEQFCSLKFNVTFPMLGKMSVRGKSIHPLYAWLTAQSRKKVSWNFNKFLIGRDGELIELFGSRTAPDSKKLITAIEVALEHVTIETPQPTSAYGHPSEGGELLKSPPREECRNGGVGLSTYRETTSQSLNALAVQEKEGTMEKATFAAGCFWGVESAFRTIEGVLDAPCGYIGGERENPTYKEVCSGRTGHAEAVEVTFDPAKVSYAELVELFWRVHNPAQVNRQGPDRGTQYRSAIFFHSEEQKQIAEASKLKLELSDKFKKPIATQIVPAAIFYRAEKYHQRYFEKSGRPACHFFE